MSLVLCPMLTWSLGWIGLVGQEAIAAGQLDGPIGDHLVGVHVAGRAGAGLVDVDGKLGRRSVPRPLRGRRPAGPRPGDRSAAVLAAAGQLAQIAVGDGGGQFDQPQSVDQLRGQRLAGDGEILHGPLRLGAVVSLGGKRTSPIESCSVRNSLMDRSAAGHAFRNGEGVQTHHRSGGQQTPRSPRGRGKLLERASLAPNQRAKTTVTGRHAVSD